jgi:murein DD-endopeptidase MepM/ murein hydrolase activator NlpD
VLVLLFLLPQILLACLGNPTGEQNGLTSDEIKTITPLPPVQSMTPTRILEQLATQTPEPATFELRTPQLVELPTEVNLHPLCSPLADHSLDEIKDIVSDPYDPPPMGRDERHHGVDLAYFRRGDLGSIMGVEVQSILPGRVISVIYDRLPYGNMVIIETVEDELPREIYSVINIAPGESLYHLYAHFGEVPEVELGDKVLCGQKLGEVGMTGYNIVNPHLHLETRLGLSGKIIQEMSFYNTGATPEEMENYRMWRMSGEFRHFDPLILFTVYWGE